MNENEIHCPFLLSILLSETLIADGSILLLLVLHLSLYCLYIEPEIRAAYTIGMAYCVEFIIKLIYKNTRTLGMKKRHSGHLHKRWQT